MTKTIFGTLIAAITAASFTVHLNASTVTVLTGVVIPLLTALSTKVSAPTWVKQAFTLFLSAAAGLLSQAVGADGTAVLSQAAIQHAAIAYVIAVASYLGWYKRDGGSINDVLAPNFGIGPKPLNTAAIEIPAEQPALEPEPVPEIIEGIEPAGEWPPPADTRPGAGAR